MDYINRIFFPKAEGSSEEDKSNEDNKEESWKFEDERDYDYFERTNLNTLNPRLRQHAERPRMMSEREVREVSFLF